MSINEEINALEQALARVRSKLLAADVMEPGFGEVRSLYNELTDALIKVAHKTDDEIAARLDTTVKEIAEEWKSNQEAFGNWTSVLKDVVGGVGTVLAFAGYPNPLAGLISG